MKLNYKTHKGTSDKETLASIIKDKEKRMAKKFVDGIPVIEIKARPGQDDWGDEKVAFFDLHNCFDVFSAQTLSNPMSDEAVRARFDEIWESGEAATIDEFIDGAGSELEEVEL